ncbi:MAG: efflux RND transporter periplasmic adaptor subunit [Gemmatimonadota bacterium]
MNRKRAIILGAGVLAAGAALFGWSRLRDGRDDATIRLSGNVEVIDVGVSFKVPGRVRARLVDEGMSVADGQVVAVLDAEDLERELGVKEAEAAAARASLAELLAGSRPQEIARAEAAVARAEAEAVRLARDGERVAALYAREAVARREFDAAKAAADVAQARLEEAREDLLLVREGPRRETIARARARLREAEEAAALARTRLSYATVRAPLAGIVLSRNVEPGDYVFAGTPVVTVGDLRKPWVRAYVAETDLARVKVGQPVSVTNDTYPGKRYAGRVSFVSPEAEFTPKSVETRKERVKLVYRIKVDIDNPAMELKPGMPVDAVIDTAERHEVPGGGHPDR